MILYGNIPTFYKYYLKNIPTITAYYEEIVDNTDTCTFPRDDFLHI